MIKSNDPHLARWGKTQFPTPNSESRLTLASFVILICLRKRRGGDLSSTHFEGNFSLLQPHKYIPRAIKMQGIYSILMYFALTTPVLASNQLAKGAGLVSITKHHDGPVESMPQKGGCLQFQHQSFWDFPLKSTIPVQEPPINNIMVKSKRYPLVN